MLSRRRRISRPIAFLLMSMVAMMAVCCLVFLLRYTDAATFLIWFLLPFTLFTIVPIVVIWRAQRD